MSSGTTDSRTGGLRRRARRRTSIVTVLAILASVLATATASPALANLPNGCPDDSTKGDQQREVTGFRFPDGHTHQRALLVFWIHSRSESFQEAFSREVINNTGSPVSATFAAEQSQTFTLSQSISTGVEATLVENVFKATVSATVTASITTSTGISTTTTATVPPFGRILARYGLKTFDVNWTVDIYQKDSKCWYHGSFRNVSSVVPTTTELWVLS